MIKISGLTKAYFSADSRHSLRNIFKKTDKCSSKDQVHEVLKGIDLCIETGDIYGVIGKSGAGKTTLIRCLNLLEKPTKGTIELDGQNICALQGRDLRIARSKISMIFQDFSLFSQRTVLENIVFPLDLQGVSRKESIPLATELLARVGLTQKANFYPSQLSGGQAQRVAIARALICKPQVILCDEPTSALDPQSTSQILALLKSINQEFGVTLVVITHSLDVVSQLCNKVAVLDDGKIVEEGTCQKVFCEPAAKETKELLRQVSSSVLQVA